MNSNAKVTYDKFLLLFFSASKRASESSGPYADWKEINFLFGSIGNLLLFHGTTSGDW